MSAPFIEANGARIPPIGLGTWQSSGGDGEQAVLWALEAGCRHIDTAARYDNEIAVGRALAASGLARDAYFVTTKVWYTELADGALQASAHASLERLGLDHVDLLLVHWPSAVVPLAETMAALCEAKRQGLTRHIGVSNFPSRLVSEAVRLSSEPLVANQCEYHPYLDQAAVLQVCRQHGMALISYSPFGTGNLLQEPLLARLADKYRRTPAQIILRWHMQQPGVGAIPKSVKRARIRENLDVFDFAIDGEDMTALFALQRADGRLVDPAWAPCWDDHHG
jgi:diketogulonate reductase-like aldo/keto reductase